MKVNKIRIAVSGAGGGVGQSIIKSLQNSGYEVVALDGEVLGAGLYAARSAYVIPYATSPQYIDRVLEICEKEHCALFFPGLDAELPVLSAATERFDAIGTRVIVSSPAVIELSDNKQTTYDRLKSYGAKVPETVDMSQYRGSKAPLKFPFILKKRVGGARSQGLHLVKSGEQYKAILAQDIDLPSYVAQEYIEGIEYTCGTISLDGTCKGVIAMRRILRDGDTYKCFSVRDPVIEEAVRHAVTAIKPFGACNVQLRVRGGQSYIFEINARCSGTTAARTLCGFNEPKMIADYLCHKIEPTYTITEQSVLRYWKELVVPNELIKEFSSTNHLINESYHQL